MKAAAVAANTGSLMLLIQAANDARSGGALELRRFAFLRAICMSTENESLSFMQLRAKLNIPGSLCSDK
jgi:hypothetical protein